MQTSQANPQIVRAQASEIVKKLLEAAERQDLLIEQLTAAVRANDSRAIVSIARELVGLLEASNAKERAAELT